MTDVAAEVDDLTLPPDPPDEAPGREPQGDDPRDTSHLVLALLAIGLFALPVLGIVALLGLGPLSVATAEALEHTDGLRRDAFGSVWRLVWKVHLFLLAVALIRRIISRNDPDRRPWKSLGHLWIAYLVGIWITVPLDVYGVFDVPDRLTMLLLVGANALARLMLPLVLLLLLARFLALLWRRAQASVASYRRVVGLATAASLGAATVIGGAVLYDAGPQVSLGHGSPPLAAGATGLPTDIGVDDLDDLDDVEDWVFDSYVSSAAQYGAPVDLTRAFGPATTERGSSTADSALFGECAGQLATPRAGDPAQTEKAVAHLTRRWRYGYADAEDLAMEALVRVCRTYSGRSRDHVVRSYWTTLGNLRKNQHARQKTANDAAEELRRRLREKRDTQTIPIDEFEEKLKREIAGAAFRSLSRGDRQIIEMRADEKSYRSIGLELGISEVAARKRYARAEQRFYEAAYRELNGR